MARDNVTVMVLVDKHLITDVQNAEEAYAEADEHEVEVAGEAVDKARRSLALHVVERYKREYKVGR